MHYAVVGGGALGTLVASCLHRNGTHVTVIERGEERRQRLERGVAVLGYRTIVTTNLPTCDWPEAPESASALLLCVGPQQVEAALEEARRAFPDAPLLVSFVGGLRHIEMCERWPGETIFAVANLEVRLDAAGDVETGFHNFVWLGNLASSQTPAMLEVQRDLAWLAPTLTGKVVRGMLWSKALYALEAGLPPLVKVSAADHYRDRANREVAAKIVREGLAVAQAAEVEPVAFDFFDPNLYLATTAGERATLDIWMAHAWQRHEQYRFGLDHPFTEPAGLAWSLSPANPEEEFSSILEDLQASARDKVLTPGIDHLRALVQRAKAGVPVTDVDVADAARSVQAGVPA